jgi:hypothetical protein
VILRWIRLSGRRQPGSQLCPSTAARIVAPSPRGQGLFVRSPGGEQAESKCLRPAGAPPIQPKVLDLGLPSRIQSAPPSPVESSLLGAPNEGLRSDDSQRFRQSVDARRSARDRSDRLRRAFFALSWRTTSWWRKARFSTAAPAESKDRIRVRRMRSSMERAIGTSLETARARTWTSLWKHTNLLELCLPYAA